MDGTLGILGLSNVVDAQEIKKIQNRVILATGFADLKELLDMRPEAGSNFILSSSVFLILRTMRRTRRNWVGETRNLEDGFKRIKAVSVQLSYVAD